MEFVDDLKIVWKFLSKYKKQFYAIVFLAVVFSVIDAVTPYIYGKIVDSIISNQKISAFSVILLVWFFLTLIKDNCKRYFLTSGLKLSMKCKADFLLLLNSHSLNLNINFHKQFKGGKLSSKYISSSNALEMIFNETVLWFVPDVLMIVFSLTLIALFIHWLVFVVLLIYVLFYLFATFRYSKQITTNIIKLQESYEDVFGLIHDSVSNIQTVKANSHEKYENKKTASLLNGNVKKYYYGFISYLSSMVFLQNIISVFGFLSLFILISYLLRNDMITVGRAVSVFGYVAMLDGSMRKVNIYIDHFRRWIGTVKLGYDLLKESAEPYEKENAVKLGSVEGEIEFKDVSFFYHEGRQILNDIDFKVNPGHMVALVGESGVGKSTLVDLISRYNIPASGKILLDGTDIQKLDLKSLRSHIAIVPQEISLFNDTLKNNIIYGKLDATEAEIRRAVEAAHADEFINNFPDKLAQQVGERGVKLSTGQKQRVAIARAILKDPKILILDEATSALDSKSELLVQKALKKLIKGRTTFVIAHRLSTIQHADKILVLDKGRIVESGKHSALIKKKGLYYKLFTLQSLGEVEEE